MLTCPICKVPMQIGKTLSPYEVKGALYFCGPPVGNARNIALVDCYKCPSCGNSEELDDISINNK